jgi:heat shock protein HtpX
MYESIAANKRKTALLFVCAFVFLGAVGYLLGLLFGGGVVGLVIALVVAAIMSLSSYFAGDKMVLAASGARAVSAEEQPRLHNLIEGLAIASGIPKPAVYIVPERAPNAFATGRDPDHASIAVTEGLLAAMDRVELEGVLAHEMSHILGRDILIGTIIATLIGAAVLLSQFYLRSWWWTGGRRRGGGSNQGAVGLAMMAIGFALMALAPLAGQAIRLAVSRNREYLADAQGVMLTRYPPGLIAALRKLQDAPTAMAVTNDATSHLWLNQPTHQRKERFQRLFSTHPPLEERIERLQEM